MSLNEAQGRSSRFGSGFVHAGGADGDALFRFKNAL